jgi:hypothetical protein
MVRISLPPIDVLLSWPKPNYTDTAIHRGPTVYVVSSMFLALATVAVVMRLYARIIIRHWFGLDDAFICIAWVCNCRTVHIYLPLTSLRWQQLASPSQSSWDLPLMAGIDMFGIYRSKNLDVSSKLYDLARSSLTLS